MSRQSAPFPGVARPAAIPVEPSRNPKKYEMISKLALQTSTMNKTTNQFKQMHKMMGQVRTVSAMQTFPTLPR